MIPIKDKLKLSSTFFLDFWSSVTFVSLLWDPFEIFSLLKKWNFKNPRSIVDFINSFMSKYKFNTSLSFSYTKTCWVSFIDKRKKNN